MVLNNIFTFFLITSRFISFFALWKIYFPHDLLIVNKTDTDRWITLNAGNNFQIFRPKERLVPHAAKWLLHFFKATSQRHRGWQQDFSIFNIKLAGLLRIKNSIWISTHGLPLQNKHNVLSCREVEIVLSYAFFLLVI